jgi:hypothetical protein
MAIFNVENNDPEPEPTKKKTQKSAFVVWEMCFCGMKTPHEP